MNFLAHSLLGFDDPALIAGQFCGDFVRGNNLAHLPQRVEQGIRLHRHLDRFTDTHPLLVEIRSDLIHIPRRFAGIVIDVLFDHFLARHWDRYSQRSLNAHADMVHQALHQHHDVLPESLQRFTVLLTQHAILTSNTDLVAIELTLRRLSKRSARFHALAIPIEQLASLRDSLHEPFVAFYPALRNAATGYLGNPTDRSQLSG